MNTSNPIDVQTLLINAKSSEHHESYIILKKCINYRLGAGVRLISPDHPLYFFEILIFLCFNSSNVDLLLLEKNINFLKQLRGRGYNLCCQNDSSINCEIILPKNNLITEYETIKSILQSLF